jgi:hypothetical protein
MLLDSKSEAPTFASMDEMKMVRRAPFPQRPERLERVLTKCILGNQGDTT